MVLVDVLSCRNYWRIHYSVFSYLKSWTEQGLNVNWSCLNLLSCRNVCATEYAEVCEERVATRLGELFALVHLKLSIRCFNISPLFTHVSFFFLCWWFRLVFTASRGFNIFTQTFIREYFCLQDRLTFDISTYEQLNILIFEHWNIWILNIWRF